MHTTYNKVVHKNTLYTRSSYPNTVQYKKSFLLQLGMRTDINRAYPVPVGTYQVFSSMTRKKRQIPTRIPGTHMHTQLIPVTCTGYRYTRMCRRRFLPRYRYVRRELCIIVEDNQYAYAYQYSSIEVTRISLENAVSLYQYREIIDMHMHTYMVLVFTGVKPRSQQILVHNKY
jgi:hypothetical protein